MKTETYACQSCGADVVRPVARGQRPKWCPECRRIGARGRIKCEGCGVEVVGSGTRFCSIACCNRSKPPRPRKPKVVRVPSSPLDQRSDLRKALEMADHKAVINALRALSQPNERGCWIWQRRVRDGYPEARVGRRSLLAHRIALEAKHGAPLGSQAAHHICAESSCVNPDHLQPVTHRENVAEMLARQSYLARIRELEGALASVAPDHPLLTLVAVA